MNSLALRLKDQLIESRKSIAVAESLTGGQLQALISSVSGSSEYFLGGVTAYNIDQKAKLLGVDRKHAAQVHCVSATVAEQMVKGVRELFSADIALATTGYAEPWPERQVNTPHAFFAIDIEGQISSGRINVTDRSRVEVQMFIAEEILQILIETLGDK